MRGFIITVLLLSAIKFSLLGQQNYKHPLLKSLPNFEVVFTETKFDEIEVPVSEVELITLSGTKTLVGYQFNHRTSVRPNGEQILKMYSDMFTQLGGSSVHIAPNFGTYKVPKDGNEYWVIVETYKDGEQYNMALLNREKTGSDDADRILAEINAKGQISLYISFASGQAALPSDSGPIIAEIAKLMGKAAELRLRIEGHTDNVGVAANNKKLSEERAISVMQALVKKGVSPSRLEAIGYGQEKPIADNSTDKGRYENRRVELVKINK